MGTDYNDSELLNYSLKLLGLNREELIKKYNKTKEIQDVQDYNSQQVIDWVKKHSKDFA